MNLPKAKIISTYSAYMFLGIFAVICLKFLHAYVNFPSNESKYLKNNNIQRGSIFDSRGYELALSEPSWSVGIQPDLVYDAVFTAKYLSPILKIPSYKIESSIQGKKKFFFIKREISGEDERKIDILKLPGVRTQKEWKRTYPNKTLAAPLLGFTGFDDDLSISGIEKDYHDLLYSTKDPKATRGADLYLTIDPIIQTQLEKSIEKAFLQSRSSKAMGILVDLNQNQIIAMASFPNFDPNQFWEAPLENQTNWAIRHLYEPGSTMKVIAAYLLLHEKVIKPSDRVYCPGFIDVGKVTIKCAQKHESVNIEEILTKSCNVGIIKMIQKLDNQAAYDLLTKLHFGKKTGFSTLENKGYFPAVKQWNISTPYFLSIGQGISVTPIQLLTAFGTIFNGGNFHTPTVLKKAIYSSGEDVALPSKTNSKIIVEPEVRDILLKSLQRVILQGTGRNAFLSYINIGGKTGTSQKATPGKGYEEGKWTASFIGLFPIEKPKYAGLVIFDEPKLGDHTGGGLAAPVFKEFVQNAYPYLEPSVVTPIQPSNSLSHQKKYRFPEGEVPNLKGLTKKEVIQILKEINIKYSMEGSGFLEEQNPPPGTTIDKTQIWKLRFSP
jgi:cell division protein FtsI/penicillin-binding protein 2